MSDSVFTALKQSSTWFLFFNSRAVFFLSMTSALQPWIDIKLHPLQPIYLSITLHVRRGKHFRLFPAAPEQRGLHQCVIMSLYLNKWQESRKNHFNLDHSWDHDHFMNADWFVNWLLSCKDKDWDASGNKWGEFELDWAWTGNTHTNI